MGFLDAIFRPLIQSSIAPPLKEVKNISSRSITRESFHEIIDLNTSWRYFLSDCTSSSIAERHLINSPIASFILWNCHTSTGNALFISIRPEIGPISHAAIGVLLNGFHLYLPCNKPSSECNSYDCGLCIPIPDLDLHLHTNCPHALVGLRYERNLPIFERVSWSLHAPDYTPTSLPLYLRSQDVFIDMRFLHLGTDIIVSHVREDSVAYFSGIRTGYRLVHVNGQVVPSIHGLQSILHDVSPTEYIFIHFQCQPEKINETYQVTLMPTDRITSLNDCGLKFRRVFDMIFVIESTGYASRHGISKGSVVLSVNGIRVPFMGFEQLAEFVASSSHIRIPLTLDLFKYDQDSPLIETEKFLMTASLNVYHVVKATEQLRLLILTFHSRVLVPLNLSEIGDTSALEGVGPLFRNALLPFLATTRGPTSSDMIRLIKCFRSRFRQITLYGSVMTQYVLIMLFTLCYIEDKNVHREATWAFRDIMKLMTVQSILFYAMPLIHSMKMSSKSMVRQSSVGIMAEYIQRIHKKTISLDENERMPGLVDMEELSWRHQMLEAGIHFAELCTDNEPSVSCAARQHLPSMMTELLHYDVNWAWMVPLIELLSKALMPDGRLDALHLCHQLAQQYGTSFWRMRLAGVFSSLANDGNDSIRKAAAQKFVDFATKINLKELADIYDACHYENFSPKSSSCLIMSDIRETPVQHPSESLVGSADSNMSEIRRRCISSDVQVVTPTATEDNMHILFALLDAYTNLMQDAPVEIQKIACQCVHPMAKMFGKEVLCRFILPTIQDVIVTDMHDCKCHGSSAVYESVHHILAREMCRLAPMLANDPELIASEFLPFLTRLLSNVKHTHIIAEVLENFDSLGYALGDALFIKHLVPPMMKMVNVTEWKLRVAVAYNLGPLLQWLGADKFMEHFKDMVETLSHDRVHQVRQHALDVWTILFQIDASQKWKKYALQFMSTLSSDANYHLRISCLYFYMAVIPCLCEEEIETCIMPAFIKFSQDPIPNVRVVCARELCNSKLSGVNQEVLWEAFREDLDVDVQFYASQNDSSD